MNNALVFDIETAPLPDTELEKVKPFFSAPAHFKDIGKIAAAVAEKEASWREQAALSALTGRVLAIGAQKVDSDYFLIENDDEARLLSEFWLLLRTEVLEVGGIAIGFNIFGFDLPFLVRRSWRLGIRPPSALREGRYWNRCFVDLFDHWALSEKERVSLRQISAFFEIGEKAGDGRNFSTLWKTDRPQAEVYLRRDIELTLHLAYAMQILPAAQAGLLDEWRQALSKARTTEAATT